MKPVNFAEIGLCGCQRQASCTGFEIIELVEGETIDVPHHLSHSLLYVQHGAVSITPSVGSPVCIEEGEMALITTEYEVSFKAEAASKMIAMPAAPASIVSEGCPKIGLPAGMEERLKVYKANNAVALCYNSIEDYLRSGLCCGELQRIKKKELFILLHASLSLQEVEAISGTPDRKGYDFIAKVQEHIQEATTVTEVADSVGLERAYFQKMFRKYFHTTPYKWMQGLRAKRAIKMLEETGTPIKAIADELGFSSISHFNSFCKKNFGHTARKIREKRSDYNGIAAISPQQTHLL